MHTAPGANLLPGTVFSIPLEDGRLGVGLAIRVAESLAMSCFFPIAVKTISEIKPEDVNPENVLYTCIHGLQPFAGGMWKPLGPLRGFDLALWPEATFWQPHKMRAEYLDERTLRPVKHMGYPHNRGKWPTAGVCGHIYVQGHVLKLIRKAQMFDRSP